MIESLLRFRCEGFFSRLLRLHSIEQRPDIAQWANPRALKGGPPVESNSDVRPQLFQPFAMCGQSAFVGVVFPIVLLGASCFVMNLGTSGGARAWLGATMEAPRTHQKGKK
jgi:hypothetical protein